MCNCSKRRRNLFKYVWTSDDGANTVEYDSEIVARAKVQRVGGTYKKVAKA